MDGRERGAWLNLPHTFLLDILYMYSSIVMFTLILFVCRDAQHPQISEDILVHNKTVFVLM